MLNSMNYTYHMYIIWEALHSYREECLPEDQEKYDEEWNDITNSMSWIATGLRLTDKEIFDYDPIIDH